MQFDRSIRVLLPLVFLLGLASAEAGAVLSLRQAEQLAVSEDPGIQRLKARAQALSENAIADSQLPDPKLKLGAVNVPVDTFNFSDTPMTQLQLGVRQSFPRGQSLRYRSRRTAAKGRAEEALAEDKSLLVLRAVRRDYLEAWYNQQAARIVEDSRKLFRELVEITERHYGIGKQTQQDVASAQLELSLLEDRLIRIREQEEIARAALGRWTGEAAYQPLESKLPALPRPPQRQAMLAALEQHPRIRAEEARREAANQGVQLALEQYKPGFALDISYGFRSGQDLDGSERPDLFSAVLLIDLPLFTDKRQDRRLSASRLEKVAAGYARIDRLRDLRKQLDGAYGRWRRLGEREKRFEQRLLGEAKLNAEAALSAYQNGITEFTPLVRARLRELDARLQMLRIRVDRAKTQADLLYLAGQVGGVAP